MHAHILASPRPPVGLFRSLLVVLSVLSGSILAADSDWDRLASLRPSPAEKSVAPEAGSGWLQIEAAARAYRQAHPDDDHARSARALELRAQIESESDQSAESPETATAVESFLRDAANPVRDRLALEIASDQAGLRRLHYASRRSRTDAHAAHARKLMAAFPDQPEGFGYLLSLAKVAEADQARALATELINSSAPPGYRAGAQRVLDRLALVGRPFALDAPEAAAAIAAARGHWLVVYAWTTADPGFGELVVRLSAPADEVRFIGINLDADVASARAAAVAQDLPGLQLYDGGGLDGPLATQLHLILTESLFVIDRDGVVREVDGADDPLGRVAQLVAEGGAR